MTSQEPENPQIIECDIPDTEVVIPASQPAPVFVDTTGRRSRLMRRVAYGFGGLVMLYGGLLSVSLAGGPVRSSAVLPLPGLEPDATTDTKAPARPSPTPAPATSHAPPASPLFITDALPRRTTATGKVSPRLESTRITSKAGPATTGVTKKPTTRPATPKPSRTTSHPVESTTTPATTPGTTPATTPATAAPEPPSSGQGGGSGTGGTRTGGTTGGSGSGGSGGGTSGGTGSSSNGSGSSDSGGTTTTAAPAPPASAAPEPSAAADEAVA